MDRRQERFSLPFFRNNLPTLSEQNETQDQLLVPDAQGEDMYGSEYWLGSQLGRSAVTSSPRLRRRRRSSAGSMFSTASQSVRWSKRKMRERHDWLRKFSPLSSTDLLSGVKAPKSSISKKSNAFIVDPASKDYYYWLMAISLVTVYFIWTVVLRSAFDAVHEGALPSLLWFTMDLVCVGFYVGDIYVRTHTSYLHDGILEEDLAALKRHYLASFGWYVDVVAVVPLDIMYFLLFWSPPPPYLQWPKLLKLYRLKEFSDRTESYSRFPHMFRVLSLIHNLLVIIHWNACVYFLLSWYIGYGKDEWVYPSWNDTYQAQWGALTRQYIYCFYWSTLTLTTIGELPKPITDAEYVFVTLDYLIGILMFATLVGNMGGIIANMRKIRAKFQQRMDSIKVYMHQMNVPNHLQERVIKWFDYLCTHGHPIDDQTVLNYLPDKLKAEIGIHVHFETLKKVDFFEECEQGLLWELVLRLQMQVYSPGEYVCRKGDVGREMYIVSHGKLEVLPEENGEVLTELKPGDYFGEIGVLNLGRSHHRRTAFVRSVGYSDLLCLSRMDLLEVMQDYPQAMETLRAKGQKKLEIAGTPIIETPEMNGVLSNSSDSDPYSNSTSDEFEEDSDSEKKSSDRDSTTTIGSVAMMDQVIEIHYKLNHVEGMLKELLAVHKQKRTSRGSRMSQDDIHLTLNGYKHISMDRKISAHM